MKRSMKRRVIAGLLAFALVLSTAFSTTATTTSAASNKAVKTVTLKIGKKNVTKKTYTMKKGATATVKVTVKPSSAKKAIAYKTNSKKIVTVSKKGKITAKGKGTAKITVTVTGKNKKKKSTYLKVKVTEPAATTAAPVATTAAPVVTTAAPAATTAAPAATPEAPATVPSIKKIEALNSSTGTVTVTFEQATKAENLAKTTLTVSDGTNSYVATFTGLSTDGQTATYTIPAADLPSLGTGTYTISSETVKVPANTTVKATEDTKENVDGLTVTVANSIKDYTNTVLTGTNADLQVSLTKDGVPVKATDVTITLDPMYGYTPGQASIFGFTGDKPNQKTVKTGDDGTVKTTVGLLADYNKYTATSGYYASYKVTATATGSNETATTTLSFASVVISDSIVLNNIDPNLSDIEPSENANAGDDGISSTVGYNDAVNAEDEVEWEYVHSQQVSTVDADHKVYVAAAPILKLPATEGDTSVKDYARDLTAVSDEYTVYAGEGDASTTTCITDVPAGLQSATLNFDYYDISEFTRMVIKCVNKDGEVVRDNEGNKAIYIKTGTVNKESVVNLPVQSDQPIDVIVYLESEGQVNDDKNSGYKITGIEGKWKSTTQNKFTEVELPGTVTWEKEELKYDYTPNLSYADVAAYVPAKYNKTSYSFEKAVPQFPSAATAYITVKDPNGEEVDYYICSTQNKLGQNGGYTNTLETTGDYGGIKATKDEVTYQSVGNFKQDGNTLIMDSTKSGISAYVGTITCDLLSAQQLDRLNNQVHTSVQWAPVPTKEVSTGEDFYALQTQNVVIKAKVTDNSASKNPKSDVQVTFSYNNDKQEIPANNSAKFGPNNEFEVVSAKTITNSEGIAELTVKAANGAEVLQLLTAETTGYDTQLEIGDKQVNAANIHWVDAGLSFTNQAGDQGETTKVYNTTKQVNLKDRKVGAHWIFGYNLIGQTSIAYGQDGYDGTVAISNVGIDVQRPNNAKEFEEKNGIAKLYVEKSGEDSLVGGIESKEYGKDVSFVVSDTEGNVIGTYQNVGQGTAAIDAKISLKISWKTNGEKAGIIFPWGSKLDMDCNSTAYIQVLDNYGNAISDKTINYTVGDNNTVQGTTDENGLIQIELTAPGEETNVTIKCTDLDINEQIQYKNNSAVNDFALVNAEATDNKTVKLTFTNNLNKQLLNKNMFEIKNAETENDLTIASVEVDSKNLNVVNIKLDNTAEFVSEKEYKVSAVTNKDSTTGITYRLVDTYGNLLKTGFDTVSFVSGTTYKFTDETKISNNELTVGIKNKELTEDSPVYVVASTPGVLNGVAGGVTKVTNNINNILTITPQTSQSEVTLYYKGISKTITIPAAGTNN